MRSMTITGEGTLRGSSVKSVLVDLRIEGEDRVDVYRNVLRDFEGRGELGRHRVVLGEEGLRAGAAAGSFNGQEFLGESGDYGWDAIVVDGVAAAGIAECVVFEEIIELHHLGAAVGFAGAESKGPEQAGD